MEGWETEWRGRETEWRDGKLCGGMGKKGLVGERKKNLLIGSTPPHPFTNMVLFKKCQNF